MRSTLKKRPRKKLRKGFEYHAENTRRIDSMVHERRANWAVVPFRDHKNDARGRPVRFPMRKNVLLSDEMSGNSPCSRAAPRSNIEVNRNPLKIGAEKSDVLKKYTRIFESVAGYGLAKPQCSWQ